MSQSEADTLRSGQWSGYALGLKTAISIPDELFSKVEELARAMGKSRSQLFRDALIEYLLRRDPEEITRSMDEALADIDDQNDRWLGEAGRHMLQRSEW